jgi:hypothetical protein
MPDTETTLSNNQETGMLPGFSDCTEKAGASPFSRYQKAKKDGMPANLGALTLTIPPTVYFSLYEWAKKTPDWRERMIDAIENMCRR